MTIETLTEEERTFLSEGIASYHDAKKALRIIDAHASALAEARAECERLRVQEQNAGKLAVHHLERAMTAESRLAAANALLKEWRGLYAGRLLPGALARQTDAHLADQALPRTECERLRAHDGGAK